MPQIEVDEHQFLTSKATHDLVSKMMANPESRRHVLQARKVIEPNAAIPELDAVKPVNDAIDEMRKTLNDGLKAINDRDTEREVNARKQKLQDNFAAGRAKLAGQGYTKDAIDKIEKLMEDRGLLSHEDASIIFDKLNPPPQVVTPVGHGPAYNFFDLPESGADDTKALLMSKGEDGKALSNLIRAGLNEVRNAR